MSLLSRRIDLRTILRRHNVEFTESGKNVKQGNLNVRCPWCGSADPSMHMGIHLETLAYACWRNAKHRGRNPARILSKVCKIPWNEAKALVSDEGVVDVDEFSRIASGEKFKQEEENPTLHRPDHLDIDHAFRSLNDARYRTARAPYIRYLKGRGLSRIPLLVKRFDLRYSVKGTYSGRLIMPYLNFEGDVLTWTARAIAKSEIRYLALPENDSVLTTKETLYGMHLAKGGKALVIVEGPFDVLSFFTCCRSLDCSVIGISSAYANEYQLSLILLLSKLYDSIGVCLDVGTVSNTMRMVDELKTVSRKPVFPMRLHRSCSDPGDAKPIHLRRSLMRLLRGM